MYGQARGGGNFQAGWDFFRRAGGTFPLGSDPKIKKIRRPPTRRVLVPPADFGAPRQIRSPSVFTKKRGALFRRGHQNWQGASKLAGGTFPAGWDPKNKIRHPPPAPPRRKNVPRRQNVVPRRQIPPQVMMVNQKFERCITIFTPLQRD